MDLGTLLKLASLFRGLNLADVERLAVEQGVPVAHKFILDHARKAMTAAVPKIVANLKTKAPLDGQKRKDLDGVEFEDWAYLSHESLYLLVKAVVRKGGLFIDGWRDSHLAKVLAQVASADHTTQEAVVLATLDAELSVTF